MAKGYIFNGGHNKEAKRPWEFRIGKKQKTFFVYGHNYAVQYPYNGKITRFVQKYYDKGLDFHGG